MEERRVTDSVILNKLNDIHTDQQVMKNDLEYIKEHAEEREKRIEKVEHAVHGNGSQGLKTKVATIHVRVMALCALVGVMGVAVARDLFSHFTK